MSEERIWVTGASGFVGGWVVERGGASMFGSGRRHVDSPHYAALDLAELEAHDEVPGLGQPTAVIHCAALAAPYAPLAEYERNNVEATRRLLAWCERHGRPRLVHVSSSSVLYRDGDQLGLTEDSPVGPEFANDYARTKAASEELVRHYGGSWVIARPRAVFGPRDTVLFPRIIAAAKAGRMPRLTGRDEPAIGDVIYVENLADRLLALARRPELGGVYNLTDAEPVDLMDMIFTILARLGYPPPRRTLSISRAMRAARLLEGLWRHLHVPGEPPITPYGIAVLTSSKTFDPTRMLRDLGAPPVALREGVDRFVAWQSAELAPAGGGAR